MPTKKSWIERIWRGCLFVAAAIVLLTVAVMGWHWTDTANKPFWWTFWVIAAVLAIPGLIGLLLWFDKSRKNW
jgi:hypothetical protein